MNWYDVGLTELTCPYCDEEVAATAMGKVSCEHCGKDFVIEQLPPKFNCLKVRCDEVGKEHCFEHQMGIFEWDKQIGNIVICTECETKDVRMY